MRSSSIVARRVLPGMAVLAAAASAFPARAQEPARPWTLEASVGRETYRTDAPGWRAGTRQDLSLYRRGAVGALGVGAFRMDRLGESDAGGSVDAYRTLWAKAYANVRVQGAGGKVVPSMDASAELYQGLPGGWEPAIGYRHMTFPGADVDLATLSLGLFVGDAWHGRVRGSVAWQHGDAGRAAASLLVRRYLRSGAELVEVAGGTAEEAHVIAGVGSESPTVVSRRTRFIEATARAYPFGAVGGVLSVGHHAFEGAPGRRSLRAGVIVRW